MWMKQFVSLLTVLVASVAAVPSSSPVKNVFVSENYPDHTLRYVKNSGVCEMTKGVQTRSGYIDIGKNMSMWFWFFEARNAPETAPFGLWLNGGPGCSSMIGLFQENGPCQVKEDGKTVVNNTNSWNNVVNMIYVDQPIGTGFSYGTDTVNSTEGAPPYVWKFFQLLFESQEFAKYESREFVFATESYGGRYGPAMVTYFDQQNTLIQQKKIKGEPVKVSALMINNGWYDPLLQNKAYVDFAFNAPGYGPLQPPKVLKQINESYYKPGGCRDQELACYAAGSGPKSNKICLDADNYCINNVFNGAVGNRDSYDLSQDASSPFPSESYLNYLQEPSVMKKIGAEVQYQECPDAPYNLFEKTGDDARTGLSQLANLVNSRLKVLIWAGDLDINCNWLGGHAAISSMDWYGKAQFAKIPFHNITYHGKAWASVQNLDNFSFARVYGAGHEVPAYKPAQALETLKQVLAKEPLHSA